MRLSVVAIGKLKAGADRELFARFWDRLEASGRKTGLIAPRVVELSESRAGTAAGRKTDEAARLLAAARDGSEIVALDEAGSAHTSESFAAYVGKRRDGGCAEMAFLIGGPDGHGAAVHQRARLVLNLGTLTLPHGLARIVLAEQLYRATTILAGHPYHRN
jgi:23S rRNA (pseudouridine1915-N3)-methyltransferase